MSTIGPDPRINLATGLDRVDAQLDDLRRQQGADAHELQGSQAAVATEVAPAALDAGEQLLAAPAWDAAGPRMLPGDLALEARLGALPLAEAAESAVDTVLEAFA